MVILATNSRGMTMGMIPYLERIQNMICGRVERTRNSIATILVNKAKAHNSVQIDSANDASSETKGNGAAPGASSGDGDEDGDGDPDSDRRHKSPSPTPCSSPTCHPASPFPAADPENRFPRPSSHLDLDVRAKRRDGLALVMFLILLAAGIGLIASGYYVSAGILWASAFKCVCEALKS